MIRVPGTLIVNRREGRNGSFSVGELITQIGEFKVKDTALDQFEPGEYKGDFVIKWIEPITNTWRGRVFVENRATLQDIIIIDALEDGELARKKADAKNPPEQDPIEANGNQPVAASNEAPPTPAAQPTEEPDQSGDADDSLKEERDLLGELFEAFANKQTIKLDPSVDRELFRKQRDLLRNRSYRFNSTEQVWDYKPSNDK